MSCVQDCTRAASASHGTCVTVASTSRRARPLYAVCAGGLAPPLYIHSSTQGSIQGRLREGSPESEWEQRVTQLFRSQVPPPTLHAVLLSLPLGTYCYADLQSGARTPCRRHEPACMMLF